MTDGQGVEGQVGGRMEVLRRAPGFLACSVELGNSRGSGVGGKSMSLALDLLSLKYSRGDQSRHILQGEVAQRLCPES